MHVQLYTKYEFALPHLAFHMDLQVDKYVILSHSRNFNIQT